MNMSCFAHPSWYINMIYLWWILNQIKKVVLKNFFARKLSGYMHTCILLDTLYVFAKIKILDIELR